MCVCARQRRPKPTIIDDVRQRVFQMIFTFKAGFFHSNRSHHYYYYTPHIHTRIINVANMSNDHRTTMMMILMELSRPAASQNRSHRIALSDFE